MSERHGKPPENGPDKGPGGNPNAPLLLMMGLVPLVVGLAVLAAVVLARNGFGPLVALGVPFTLSTFGVVVLGVWLARVAAARSGGSGDGER